MASSAPSRRPAGAERRSPRPAALRRRESIRRLKEALAQDRLALHYQPIVDLASGEALSAEALLRWRAPERESDALPRLIAAAERSPVIFALERWSVARGCRAAAAWRQGALPGVGVNLNLSAREFQRRGLRRRLLAALRESGLPATAVTLEVTESSAIHDPASVAPLLDGLKQEGFQVWLDDFGTGHSSLAWLRSLPLDGLKIPGEFVGGVARGGRDATIAAAVIALGHRLGLRIVAEGVEREDQLDWLRGQGCDAVQGFLFCEAVPPEGMARRLAAAHGQSGERPSPGVA